MLLEKSYQNFKINDAGYLFLKNMSFKHEISLGNLVHSEKQVKAKIYIIPNSYVQGIF